MFGVVIVGVVERTTEPAEPVVVKNPILPLESIFITCVEPGTAGGKAKEELAVIADDEIRVAV